MKKWEELNSREKQLFIRTAIKNKVYNLKDIKNYYNNIIANKPTIAEEESKNNSLYHSSSAMPQQYYNNAFLNKYKDGGKIKEKAIEDIIQAVKNKTEDIGTKIENHILKTPKDIAYRLMSVGPKESRNWEEVAKATLEHIIHKPLEEYPNYVGNYRYGDEVTEFSSDPNWERNANKLFLYRDESGYQRIPEAELRGHDYTPFYKKHYPLKRLPKNYYGNIVPEMTVPISKDLKPLTQFIAEQGLGTYEGILEPTEEQFYKTLDDNYFVDDVASYRTGIGKSPEGNLEFQLSDLIDFGAEDYEKRWGTKAAIQGALLNAVGHPYLLRQYVPIQFTEGPIDNESGIRTLMDIAKEHNIVQHIKDDLYGTPWAYPELVVTPDKEEENKKSTGGPLYPFSFEKNPFLKTPIVRYEDGGDLYTVKSGDVLGKIASNYNMSIEDFLNANPGLKADKIYVGQQLNIPQIDTRKTKGPVDLADIAIKQFYAESTFSPKAKSGVGAVGLGQIMQPALDDYNKANKTNHTLKDLEDEDTNIKVSKWYMNSLRNRDFVKKGNATDSIQEAKVLASYNYGVGNVLKVLQKAKEEGKDIYDSWDWLEGLPKETEDYVNFILRNQNVNKHKNPDALQKAVDKNPELIKKIKKHY